LTLGGSSVAATHALPKTIATTSVNLGSQKAEPRATVARRQSVWADAAGGALGEEPKPATRLRKPCGQVGERYHGCAVCA